VIAAALFATFAAATATAQPVRRSPRPDTPFLTVGVFRSADRIAGPAASDALRERLIQVYPGPVLWVIDKPVIMEILEQSGYETNQQLARTDENALAKQVRADEYIRGTVTREADGTYRIDAQLVLTRDASLTQPLPPSRARTPERAAFGLVRSIQDARRQIANEKKCMEHARANRYAPALAEAEEAIAAYPNATLVRYCKMNVLLAQKAPNAEIIKVADEILALDASNRAALAVAADAQKAEGNIDAANELLVRLLAIEPNNATLATQVVDALAASRRYDVAKQIVTKAVQDNPGDVSLIRLQFLILSSAGDYKPAIATGEEMVKLDTSMADAAFFTRLTALYVQDSQLVKAADAARRGTEKFPRNADLWQQYAQTLRNSAALATDSVDAIRIRTRSVEAAKQALAINPFIPSGWIQVAQAYGELQQPDSVLSALHSAVTAGDNADFIAQLASGLGNQKRLAGAAAKSVETLADGVAILQWTDSVAALADSVGAPDARRLRTPATPETRARVKFILGATAITLAQTAATAAGPAKDCALSRQADEALVVAQIALPGAGAFQPGPTAQLLQSIPEYAAFVRQQIATFCK
jgi:tetratricopeptide (TPR) repeat protein